MTADIELVTRVQSLDIKIAELDRDVAALPKHIAQIEKTLVSHLRRLDADRAALAANQKDRKLLEDDIKVHELKVSKLRDQTQQAKTNEQFKAFQNEIDFAQREIRKCEDRILELMGQAEQLTIAVEAAEKVLKEERRQVESEKAQARESTAADQAKIAQFHAERAETVAQMKPEVHETYERVRKKRKGRIAIAEAANGRCTACMIALRSQFFQDLRKADQIMLCESCGCILYVNAPVSFEHDLAGQHR